MWHLFQTLLQVTDRLDYSFKIMIRGAEENGHNVIKHYISDLDVHPCRGCGVCMSGKDCVFKDDGLTVTHQIAEAEGLIVSTPDLFRSDDR